MKIRADSTHYMAAVLSKNGKGKARRKCGLNAPLQAPCHPAKCCKVPQDQARPLRICVTAAADVNVPLLASCKHGPPAGECRNWSFATIQPQSSRRRWKAFFKG